MIFGTISGRLTADPQVKQGQNSTFTTFSIAVNHSNDQVTFVDCTANGKTGEFIAQRFKKGNVFSGPAELRMREYESNGQKRQSLSATVSMIDWQASQPTPQEQNQAPTQGYPPQPGYGAPPVGYGAPSQYGQPPQNGGAPQYGNVNQPPYNGQPPAGNYGAQPAAGAVYPFPPQGQPNTGYQNQPPQGQPNNGYQPPPQGQPARAVPY
jgi:single-stranded DNA-binding protein